MGWGGARPNSGPKRGADGKAVNAPTKANGSSSRLHAEPKRPRGAADARQPIFSNEAVERLLTAFQQRAGAANNRPRTPEWSPFQIESATRELFPAIARPKNKKLLMANDDALQAGAAFATNAWLNGGLLSNFASEGLLFLGYPVLAELSQRPEYRLMSEIPAEEMTRKWTKFRGTDDESTHEKDKPKDRNDDDEQRERERRQSGEEPRSDARNKEIETKIKELKDFEEELKVKAWFKNVAAHDSFFGISHLFLDFGDGDLSGTGRDPELATAIGNGRDRATKGKFSRKMKLRAMRTVEPQWCYPTTYNALNPLSKNWYDPDVWYVMGAEVHKTRLLPFVGRPVPDMLKPAYAFGGLSMSQMAQPYVDIWLKTRMSVGELIHAFSVMVLMTNLSTTTEAGGMAGMNGDVLGRAALFSQLRDNMGMWVVDKNTEDFKNISAPLSGLDSLQAQSQEHMFSVSRIPAVKFAGIQPMGLNATSEGELRAFEETTHGRQEQLFRSHLTTVYDFMQLTLWGARDPDITYDFDPLREMTEKEKSEIRKADAETDQIRIDSGTVSQEEARKKLAADPDSGYDGIDPDDVPDLLDEEEQGLEPEGGRPQPQAAKGEQEEGGGQDAVLPFVGGQDAFEWLESDHPRGKGGKFTSGGGHTSGSGAFKAPQLGLPYAPAKSYSSGSAAPAAAKRSNIGAPLDVSKLKKVGGQKGSNPGGVYEGEGGKRFYVKQGKSKEHVRNEMIAASLYDLAGSPTLTYRPVEGGTHIATEMAKLDKDNANKLTPEEREEAAREFAVHAWLGNWDAAGLGGDNIGTVQGTPASLDLGGALEYRAQGAPKGELFGTKVGELQTLRDPKRNKDTAKIFGGMTPNDMRESARYVTGLSDKAIRERVEKFGGDPALADKLIARKNDVAEQARYFGAEGDPKKATSTVVIPAGSALPVKELNGVAFEPWAPPEDWASVDGQADIDEPELVVPKGKEAASGLVIREKDGRTWIVQPRKQYGGYEATFPKGRATEGLSLQANAIKEAFEETGLKARITGHLGDREGDATMTRYYIAERESGDPSKHDDEAEGVVLAPAGKLDGFLNRKRDRDIAGGLDQAFDAWEESKHPRKADGEFAPKGAGESSAEKLAVAGDPNGLKYAETLLASLLKDGEKNPAGWMTPNQIGALEETYGSFEAAENALSAQAGEEVAPAEPQFKSKKEHVGHLLSHGTTVQEVLKATGWPSVSMPQMAKSLGMKLEKIKQGGVTKYKGTPMTKEEIAAAKHADYLAKQGKANASPAPAPEHEKPAPKPEPKPAPAPPAPSKFPPPTAGELEKAKKTVALQLQYVPASSGLYTSGAKAEAQKLVDAFNAKYAGKQIAQGPDLVQKVNDFKVMNAAVEQLVKGDDSKAAELQKAQAAQAAKAAAEQAEKLKKSKEEHIAKNKAAMLALGITEQEAVGFNALVEMMGGTQADVIESFKKFETQAKAHGYPISGFQYALIRNYIDGGYAQINKALRSGNWAPQQHVYARLVNNALDKMPKYSGWVDRGTNLSPADVAKYKEGTVIQEQSFTSSGIGYSFGGNVRFKIKANGKRGADFSGGANKGEKEVLFKAGTYFMVHKVSQHGGSTHIELEEIEGHG